LTRRPTRPGVDPPTPAPRSTSPRRRAGSRC
jgi:hypothetical protein